MSGPSKSGDIYDSDYKELASWDGGHPKGGSVDLETGHNTVYGSVDGNHTHISWDGNGNSQHTTVAPSSDSGGKWVVNNDTGNVDKDDSK